MIILQRVGGGRIAFESTQFVCASTLILKDELGVETNDEGRSLLTLHTSGGETVHLAVEHTLDDVVEAVEREY